MRLVLTQPAPRVDEIARRLIAGGYEVIAFAQQQLVPLRDDATRARLETLLSGSDWLIPVSPFAIRMLREALGPRRWPGAVAVAFIGPGSRQAWQRDFDDSLPAQHLLPAAEPYEGAALLSIAPFDAPAGLRIAVIRSQSRSAPSSIASRWIELLRQRGARVEELALYRSQHCDPSPAIVAKVLRWCGEPERARTAFVVTSVGSARQLMQWAGAQALADGIRQTPVWATHQRIFDAMVANSWRGVRLIEPGEASLLGELESLS